MSINLPLYFADMHFLGPVLFIISSVGVVLYFLNKPLQDHEESLLGNAKRQSRERLISLEDQIKLETLINDLNPNSSHLLSVIKFYAKTFTYGCVICCVSLIWPIFLFSGYGWRKPQNQKLVYILYNKVCQFIFGIQYTVKNLENLEKHDSYIIVSNHQSSLDLLSQSQVWPNNCTTIAKREVIYLGPFGALSYATGVVYIDRKNLKSAKITLDALARRLKPEKLKVWIFPEGTRNHGTGILPFKKGAFHLAVQAQVPICPVVFSSYYPFYCRQERRFNKGKILITCLPPIETEGLADDSNTIDTLIGTVRDKILETFMVTSAETYPSLFSPASESPLYKRWQITERLYKQQIAEKQKKKMITTIKDSNFLHDSENCLPRGTNFTATPADISNSNYSFGSTTDAFVDDILQKTYNDFDKVSNKNDINKNDSTKNKFDIHSPNKKANHLTHSLKGPNSSNNVFEDTIIDKIFESEKYDEGFTDSVTHFLDEIFHNRKPESDFHLTNQEKTTSPIFNTANFTTQSDTAVQPNELNEKTPGPMVKMLPNSSISPLNKLSGKFNQFKTIFKNNTNNNYNKAGRKNNNLFTRSLNINNDNPDNNENNS